MSNVAQCSTVLDCLWHGTWRLCYSLGALLYTALSVIWIFLVANFQCPNRRFLFDRKCEVYSQAAFMLCVLQYDLSSRLGRATNMKCNCHSVGVGAQWGRVDECDGPASVRGMASSDGWTKGSSTALTRRRGTEIWGDKQNVDTCWSNGKWRDGWQAECSHCRMRSLIVVAEVVKVKAAVAYESSP